ncbi:MAG: hypothetical protein KAS05_00705 [Candidatus Omnitrophica bacterium]|nr:hypothetical protein [Candidatus Omnitrophota bacterium]
MESFQKLLAQEAYLKSLYLSEAGIQGIVYRHAKDDNVFLGKRIVFPNQKFNVKANEVGFLVIDVRDSKIVKIKGDKNYSGDPGDGDPGGYERNRTQKKKHLFIIPHLVK